MGSFFGRKLILWALRKIDWDAFADWLIAQLSIAAKRTDNTIDDKTVIIIRKNKQAISTLLKSAFKTFNP